MPKPTKAQRAYKRAHEKAIAASEDARSECFALGQAAGVLYTTEQQPYAPPMWVARNYDSAHNFWMGWTAETATNPDAPEPLPTTWNLPLQPWQQKRQLEQLAQLHQLETTEE